MQDKYAGMPGSYVIDDLTGEKFTAEEYAVIVEKRALATTVIKPVDNKKAAIAESKNGTV